MTAEAQRRRAFWQILLIAAGLVVLTVISAGSVYLVNKAREDSKWVVHTIEAESQINALLLEIRRAESSARGFLLTQGPDFQSDHEKAVAAIIPSSARWMHGRSARRWRCPRATSRRSNGWSRSTC